MTMLRALQRYARAPPATRAAAREPCELCRLELPGEHPHLVDLDRRGLCCACRACALLFTRPGAAQGRYRTVPDRVLVDPGAAIPEDEWARLEIPVRLAFFFRRSRDAHWVAEYPSPAGPTECALPLDAWEELVARHRLIGALEPDVEALLAWGGRRAGAAFETFLVPIVACYQLVAQVRRHWRGFDGGSEVWREIDAFFERLRARARPLRGGPA